MNLIIMCFCYLFINFSYLKIDCAVQSSPRLNESKQDDVISNKHSSQKPKSEEENKESLVNVLIKEEGSEEIQNVKGLERLQLVLPAFKESSYKKSKGFHENTNRRNRKRRKWRKRNKSKGRNRSHRLRHSRKKLAREGKSESKHRFNITFESPPNTAPPKQIFRSLNLPLFKTTHDLKKEVNDKRGRNISRNTLKFGNRGISKGLQKGNVGGGWRCSDAVNGLGSRRRRCKFNPNRGAKKVVVRTHNILRGRVWPTAENMLAMSWSSDAAEEAQLWADECRLDTDMDHPSVRWSSMYGTCGQNVHLTFKKKRWGRVVRHWWNERRFFYYGHPRNNATKVGRYTQMVWYNSHKVGCGFSQCETPSGKPFYRYVCNYCPGGNDPQRLSRPYDKGTQCEACPDSCISVCNRGGCKLCTNSCSFADLWSNCESLAFKWKQWLCNTKTRDGVMRFKNCRATCQCSDKIT